MISKLFNLCINLLANRKTLVGLPLASYTDQEVLDYFDPKEVTAILHTNKQDKCFIKTRHDSGGTTIALSVQEAANRLGIDLR